MILTGTPPGAASEPRPLGFISRGVGYVREPAVYLAEGDEVQVELQSAGRLANPVAHGP